MPLPDDFAPGDVIRAADLNAIKDEVALKIDTADALSAAEASATYRPLGLLGINVLAHGADPTGETSSTAAFAAALAELDARNALLDAGFDIKVSVSYAPFRRPVAGFAIYLPAGIYRGKIDVSDRDNVTIYGDGAATVLHNDATDGSHCIQSINAALDTANRLTVRDMLITGNAASGDGIHMEFVDYFQLSNLWVLEHGRDGIFYTGENIDTGTESGVEDKVINTVISEWNGRDGLHIEKTHEIVLTGIHAEENGRHGFYGKALTNLIWGDSSVEDNTNAYDVYLDDVRYCSLDNVDIEGDFYVNHTATTMPLKVTGCNWGNLDVAGGAVLLTITGGWGNLRSVVVDRLIVSGAYIEYWTNVTANQIIVSGGKTLARTGTTTVNDSCDLSGTFEWVGTCVVTLNANNARFAQSGGQARVHGGGSLTVNKTGAVTGTRCKVAGGNWRTPTITITAIDSVSITSNLLHGSGTIVVGGAGTLTSIKSNDLLLGQVVALAADRTGAKRIRDNDGTGGSSLLVSGVAVGSTESADYSNNNVA